MYCLKFSCSSVTRGNVCPITPSGVVEGAVLGRSIMFIVILLCPQWQKLNSCNGVVPVVKNTCIHALHRNWAITTDLDKSSLEWNRRSETLHKLENKFRATASNCVDQDLRSCHEEPISQIRLIHDPRCLHGSERQKALSEHKIEMRFAGWGFLRVSLDGIVQCYIL